MTPECRMVFEPQDRAGVLRRRENMKKNGVGNGEKIGVKTIILSKGKII